MARPEKEIKQKQFENLCAIQCTEKEICSVLDVTDKTLNKWCKKTYGKSFSEINAQKKDFGKVSLRRNQLELSKTNATMAIWLGKNWLGQTDKVESTVVVASVDDALSKSLREMAEELDTEE